MVIILGLILLIIGYVAGISLLYYIGAILLIVGVVLLVLGRTGRAVGGVCAASDAAQRPRRRRSRRAP